MANSFPRMLAPIRLRGRTLRNRVVFGAHTANMAEDGLPGPRHVGYYEERARGGAAMIVEEPVPVHKAAVLTRGNFRPSDDSIIEPFKAVTAAIQRHGALAIQQLYHIGSHGDSDLSYHPHWSPSGKPSYHDSDGSHAMSEAEIEESIDGFVQAARRAQQAGFDGVEVWAAYHGMLDQFWTPWSNRREDKWGGSLENRMRFPLAVARAVAKAAPGLMMGARMSVTDWVEGGFSVEEAVEVARAYKEAGAAYICCSSGGNSPLQKIPTGPGYQVHLATAVREGAGIPTRAVGLIDDARQADDIIRGNKADMVAVARALIADPRWPWRAAATLGHEFHPAPQLQRGEPFMRHWTQKAG